MRKILMVLLSLIFIFISVSVLNGKRINTYSNGSELKINSETLKDKLIRFHVIANSDSDEDQKLKLKVRDEVIKYISPILKKSKSVDESRGILRNETNNIIKIAEKCIKNNGYEYKVETTLGMTNFPVKNYGNITLPQGEYEAYRIVIGEGKGENWWCVMFPPLCFIDVTKGQVSLDETEKEMKRVLNEDEMQAINNKNLDEKSKIKKANSNEKTTKASKVKLKLKIVEIFNK